MLDTDVLVIGGGMAGMTAAARATRRGARVVLVEVAPNLGGSATYAGYIWTAPSHEVMDVENPQGGLELRRALVDRFSDGVDWIRQMDVLCGPEVTVAHVGRGHQFDTMHYVDQCRREVERSGSVHLGARVERLETHEGAVVGAEVTMADGETCLVRASSTVLATGGFQANPEMLVERVHPQADLMTLRSNPESRGTGLRLATSVGAATGPDDAGFYGHLVPSGITLDPSEFVALALYYSEHALLFNTENRRFVDETIGDHLNNMALVTQPGARGLLIADARVHRDWMTTAYVEGAISLDKFELAQKRGARCGYAEELDELAYLPEEWGYDGKAIRQAIEAHNEAARAGTAITPERSQDPLPLDEPPYYVIECVPGITFTFHGVTIDTSGRVLDTAGRPIPGLLAAGSDIGGLYNHAYLGGLASALIFGLAAADSATASS
ncbi:FAD-dependent oxidoreductase [Pseudonocardia ailaonensis]|uniref:FAD-dependent oxidoreductase n=1 Tax=Pseudonocardia ailaonensis TaxID=367279 RepID=UPI0031E2D51F